MRRDLVEALTDAAQGSGADLAGAALIIATIEYPRLDPAPYVALLDRMGEEASAAIVAHTADAGSPSHLPSVRALNEYLFTELQFAGNVSKYDDPRNSCLNEVLDRRTGIPITLSLVYMEVAHRAGLPMDGINFPGHFLVRCPGGGADSPDLIIDPFNGGALLSERRCRVLLQRHHGDEVTFNRSMLATATADQIIVRMLLNLKRLYVHMRSFPQAREVAELLVVLAPSALNELRDRGLLSYHLNDVTGALRDLQTYLKLSSMIELGKEERQEHDQIWEHVKTLRRRVASLN